MHMALLIWAEWADINPGLRRFIISYGSPAIAGDLFFAIQVTRRPLYFLPVTFLLVHSPVVSKLLGKSHLMATVHWPEAIKPLIKKYKDKPHPLEFHNRYQLLVVVLLSAQDSDKHINDIAPGFFEKFPGIKSLSKASLSIIARSLKKVRNGKNKSKWLSELAKKINTDSNIPVALNELIALPGIGRKSANVIRRGAGEKPEGVIVDLHVVRVAPRLGIATGSNAPKIEEQLMEALPQRQWEAGMAMSFLGREICRPKNPACEICLMNKVCAYYNGNQ